MTEVCEVWREVHHLTLPGHWRVEVDSRQRETKRYRLQFPGQSSKFYMSASEIEAELRKILLESARVLGIKRFRSSDGGYLLQSTAAHTVCSLGVMIGPDRNRRYFLCKNGIWVKTLQDRAIVFSPIYSMIFRPVIKNVLSEFTVENLQRIGGVAIELHQPFKLSPIAGPGVLSKLQFCSAKDLLAVYG